MRYVDVNQLLEIASEFIPENEFRGLQTTVEHIAEVVSMRLAELGGEALELMSAPSLEPGFGGLCVGFEITKLSPAAYTADCENAPNRDAIIAAIRAADPGGED